MSGDTLFRNATIGGFNKEDVMRYIELLKKSAVENEAQLDRAMKQLAETERRAVSAEAKLEKEEEKNARLNAENEKLKERAESAESKNAALIKRLSSFENSKSKLAAIEVQLGALMVDAHMYADKIVETAKKEAKRISEETMQLVAQAKNEVTDISADYMSTSDEYGRLLKIINTKISDLPTQFDAISDSVKNDYESMDFAVESLDEIPMPEFESSDFSEQYDSIDVSEYDNIDFSEVQAEVEAVVEDEATVVEENDNNQEDEPLSVLDEILSDFDATEAEIDSIVDKATEPQADEEPEEETFSMSSFFADLENAMNESDDSQLGNEATEEASSDDETFDYTKFLDFLGDDSSN